MGRCLSRYVIFFMAASWAIFVVLGGLNRVTLTCERSAEPTVRPTAATEKSMQTSNQCGCSRQILTDGVDIQHPAIHWCSPDSSLQGPHQNAVAYSLYGSANVSKGDSSRYFQMLDIIPQQINHFYPGWRMRIYHDFRPDEPEHQLVCRTYCRHGNVDLCDVNRIVDVMIELESRRILPFKSKDLIDLNPMTWRYLPLLDPKVDRVMARDMDAEINQREEAAVRQWLDAKHTYHVMRDHQHHNEPIMGGMFAVKVFQKRDIIEALMKAMVMLDNQIGYEPDQNILAKVFWPTVKDDALVHDSYKCERDWNSLPTVPFPTQRVNWTFVGGSSHLELDRPRPDPCPSLCRPLDHEEWDYC